MIVKKLLSRLSVIILSMATLALIPGCGGGGGGSSSGGGGGALGGTAATGAPVDGFVYVIDSNGIEVNVPIEADGSFSVSVQGMTPPYLLRVVPNGAGEVLYSFANEKNITVNITPLTTLALYLAYDDDLEALYTAWDTNNDALSDAAIEVAQQTVNANLVALYDNFQIDATYYDFMNVPFDADTTGIDGVLDNLDVSIDYINGIPSVAVTSDLTFTWNPLIDTSSINIGDFAITPGSTWQITVNDSINDVFFSEVVLLPSVPNDLAEFEEISQNELSGEFSIEGLDISFNITTESFNVFGTGEPGTLISGQLAGTVVITGVFDGQLVNETVNLNTTLEWERIDDVILK